MSTWTKNGLMALLALLVVAGTAGTGSAGFVCQPCVVQIDDLTDTPTVKVFELVGGTQIDLTSSLITNLQTTGESLTFDFKDHFAGVSAQSVYFDLFEDPLGTLSDRILLEIEPVPGTLLFSGTVSFASDPSVLDLPAGATSLGGVLEDGTFQTVPGMQFGPFTDFQVRSDAPGSERGEAAEPATLLLLGSGLAALAAAARRHGLRP